MVYTNVMPSRRRKASGKKLSATAEPTPKPETKPEESRPVITQVIEVVEEEIPIEVPVSVAQDVEPEPQTEPAAPVPEEAPQTEPESHIEHEAESETRKEKVEELYQKARESNVMPEISVHKARPAASILIWAIVTILVALVTGGILFAAAKKTSPLALFARPTPTPTPTVAPTPTPTPAEVDKTSFEIRVLNGGGTPGAAGKMRTFLEDKGYTVSGTGNTDEYTYEMTEIHGKESMRDAVANLQVDLKETYVLGAVDADLSASASADIEVIVGK